ncbi:MAG TPA: energy transducer TonB [Acidobacteriaceae bacterium]
MKNVGRIFIGQALSIAFFPFISFASTPSAVKLPVCTELSFDSCHPTEGVTPPKLFHSVDAEYPWKAQDERLEGMAVVRLIVDEKGKPQQVTITHSIADNLPVQHREAALRMDENALKAVKRFRFFPAKLEGHPVMVEITVEERFHLVP